MASWQKMYPGMGFVVTASPEKADEVVRVFESCDLSSARIGEVIEERRLEIVSGEDAAVLFDFEEDQITGIE